MIGVVEPYNLGGSATDIKHYVVKDRIRDHRIELEDIGTVKMLADPLTKGLPPNVFREHVAGMGLRESL